MKDAFTRRDFLRTGGTVVASGLVLPPRLASSQGISTGIEEEKAVGSRRPRGAPAPESQGNSKLASAEELKRFSEQRTTQVPEWQSWWSTNLLRVDFDMLMTDAAPEALSKIDPEDIVSTIADAGLQSLWGYVQDPTGWLYYPSKIGHQHPGLGGRDLVAEYIAACRKHGLKFGGYYDPFEMGIEVTRHPEWRTEPPGDTVPSSPRLWGNLCFNRPGCWEFYLGIIQESMTNYDMDLVWVDVFQGHHCGCAYCQKRYQSETGRQLPFYFTPYNPDTPEFGHYFYQLQTWVNQWGMDLRRTIKKARPNCVVVIACANYGWGGEIGYTVGITKAADVITSDSAAYGYQYQHSLNIKFVRGLSPNLPFDIESSISEHHSDEMSAKQEGLLKQHFAYTLAHGGAVSYIDDMNWKGQISKKKYERMKRINAWAGERFPYLGGVPVADIGLYFSAESHVYKPKSHHWRWQSTHGDAELGTHTSIHTAGNVALVHAMIQENIPFDVLHRNRLGDLGRHKVMYMSNVEVLSEEEAAALRDFVKAGGGLVVTHRTSMRDGKYQERENFLLADLMGIDYLETPDLETSFVVVGQEDRAEGFFAGVHGETPYFEVHGAQCYVKPRESTLRLGRVARPRRPYNEDRWPSGNFYSPLIPPVMQLIDPKEIRQANAGFLYEPEIVTEHPSVVLNRYGKGRVAYCAAYPAYDYVDDIHELMLSLVNWAGGGKLDATVRTNAPGPVEIVTMEQLSKNRTVIHALNWQPEWPGVKAHGVEVAIETFGRRARRAFAVEAKMDVPITTVRQQVRVTLPPVEAWESVVIEWS